MKDAFEYLTPPHLGGDGLDVRDQVLEGELDVRSLQVQRQQSLFVGAEVADRGR